jgi:hypothetical protein
MFWRNSFNKFTHIYHFSNGHEFFAKSDQSIGGRYWKALFFEYTNSSFTEKKEKDEHLGFLGPVIRAEVGDTIVVNFKNMVSWLYFCTIVLIDPKNVTRNSRRKKKVTKHFD